MKQRKISVILSYLAQIIHILTAIFYTPIMLKILGQSEYGTYQLVESVVSYLSLFSLGFGASYVRFYAQYRAQNDEDNIARLNGMYMVIFCFLGLLAAIGGIAMLNNIHRLFGTGLSDGEYSLAKLLMGIMVVNIVFTFPLSVFDGMVTAHEELIFQKLLLVMQYLLNPFLTLPLLLLGYGSVGMVLVTSFLLVVKAIFNIYFCFKKLCVKFCFRKFKLGLLLELSSFTFFIFLNQVIEQINWSVDKFLLGRMSGTVSISVYSLAAQLNSIYIQFSSAVSEAFVPKIYRMIAEETDDSEISKLFIKVGRVQFIILGLIISGYILFGKEFICIWVGENYKESYYIGLLLLIPITIPLIEGIGVQIQRAKNRHQTRSIVYFIIAIANILISIPLIKWKGAVGAAIGTCIALILGHGLFMNYYYQYKLNISIKTFAINILKMIPALILPVVTGILLNQFMRKSPNLVQLLLKIIVYSIAYCASIYYLAMNYEEKTLIHSLFRKKTKTD